MNVAFGARPAAAALDPALRALVGDACHRSDKQYSFEERVERMFTKLHHQAVRHKTNFKNTDYDLDTQVTNFLDERNERIRRLEEHRKGQEGTATMPTADGDESENSSERKRNNIQRGKEHKCRLEELLERFRPEKATTYDEDCMDLCIPFEKIHSKGKYKEIVEEPAKVD